MSSIPEKEIIKQTIAADPACEDQAVMDAVNADEELRRFRESMQGLDIAIKATSEVPVPSTLADKLLAIPQKDDNSKTESYATEPSESIKRDNNIVTLPSKKSNLIQLAMVASIAFAVGLSFTFFNQNPDIRSGADIAMAHMQYEQEYTQRVARDVSLQEVNAKLATFGGEMFQAVGKITYANFCYFENQKSLHMVVQTDNGKFTLFVTPEDLEKPIDRQFQQDGFEGRSWKMQKADVTIIGEKGKIDDSLETRLRQSMQFSA